MKAWYFSVYQTKARLNLWDTTSLVISFQILAQIQRKLRTLISDFYAFIFLSSEWRIFPNMYFQTWLVIISDYFYKKELREHKKAWFSEASSKVCWSFSSLGLSAWVPKTDASKCRPICLSMLHHYICTPWHCWKAYIPFNPPTLLPLFCSI